MRCPCSFCLFNLGTAWVPVITYRIGRELGISRKSARRATYLVMFSPVFAFWGGALYKEGLVHLALALVVLHVLTLQRSFRVRSLVVLVVSLFALLGLRFYMIVLIAPAIGLALLLGGNKRGADGRPRTDIAVRLLRQCATVVAVVVILTMMGLHQRVASLLPQGTWEIFAQLANRPGTISPVRPPVIFSARTSRRRRGRRDFCPSVSPTSSPHRCHGSSGRCDRISSSPR